MTPASAKAPSQPQPSRKPINNPGAAFSRRSINPRDFRSFTEETSSLAEYSSPRSSSKRIAPIWAPRFKKSSLKSRATIPPFPKNKPAKRKIGTAENFIFDAMKAAMPKATNTDPISPITKPSSLVNAADNSIMNDYTFAAVTACSI